MKFKLQANQITAMTENGEWAGEVSFPFVDREQRRVVVERVFVVPNFRHHGLASQLMEQFIDYAHQHSYTVKIMCPYAKQYFKLHPEAQFLLLPQDRCSKEL